MSITPDHEHLISSDQPEPAQQDTSFEAYPQGEAGTPPVGAGEPAETGISPQSSTADVPEATTVTRRPEASIDKPRKPDTHGFFSTRKQKVGAAILGVGIALGATIGAVEATSESSGHKTIAEQSIDPSATQPTTNNTKLQVAPSSIPVESTGPQNNSINVETAPDGQPWSKERAQMIPIYNEKNNLVSPEYFQPAGNVDSNINKEAITTTINNLMHNRWTAVVTGSRNDILATFGKGPYDPAPSDSEFGAVAPQVNAIMMEHEQDVHDTSIDPNYPVGNTVVSKINVVQPASTTEIAVTTELLTTRYETPTSAEDNPATYQETQHVTLDLSYKTWTGTDGTERTMWVISGWQSF